MTDVFLSYAREDLGVAEQLAHTLEAQGFGVWWDRHIVAGHSFDDVIERELESAACVIVLWSAASIQSEWVRSEASAAGERGVLVPVNIGPVRPPLEFRRKQTVALADWRGESDHPGLQQLLTALRLHVGAPAASPAVPEPTVPEPTPEPTGTAGSGPRSSPKWRMAALALLGVVAVAALVYGLAGAPEEPSAAANASSATVTPAAPSPRSYSWRINLSNIDQEVFVEVNSIERFRKLGGEATFDLTPYLTGGDDRVYLRLGNANCFGSSLHAQFLRDGRPVGAPARYQVAVSHCGWQLDWEWTVNKTSGALKRVK